MITNLAEVMAALRKDAGMATLEVTRLIKVAVEFVHEGVTSRTPVWSGELLRNWRWSMDGTGSSTLLGPVETNRRLYGRTSAMALGTEPMRGASQAAVDATKAALSFEPGRFHSYTLSNPHPDSEKAEYGSLPSSGTSRNPAGMVRITEQELIMRLGKG